MALSRSGHHSIKNWIIKNLVGFQITWDFKLVNAIGTGFYHLGEANHDIPLSFELLEKHKEDINYLMVNYEDAPWNYTIFEEERIFKGPLTNGYLNYNFNHLGRVVFIRDFYDNLSSRIKSNERQIFTKWNEDKPHLFKVDEVYIERWKNQARACVQNKVNYLRFEDWLYNQEVREKFLMENFNVKDRFGINEIHGTQSSFVEKGDVTKRKTMVELPEELKEKIRQDNELHYLMGRLGYEYIKI